MTSNVLTVTDENRKRCIFPILPVNVLRSYNKSYDSLEYHTISAETICQNIKDVIFTNRRKLWLHT